MIDIKNWVKDLVSGLVDSIGDASPKVQFVKQPDGKSAVALVREGYHCEVVVGPEVGRRIHKIEDCKSLAEWLKRHGVNQQATEILISNEQVVAALDPKDRNGCAVVMPLALHPRFERWAKLLSTGKTEVAITQRELHRHILSSLDDFAPQSVKGTSETTSEGERLAGQIAKFNAVRNVEVTCEVDELGFTRFAGKTDKTEVSGKLPPKFSIRVPMFLDVCSSGGIVGGTWVAGGGEISYDVEMFLGVEPSTEKGPPTFTLTCPQLEVVRRKARLDVVKYLRELLVGTDFLVGLGTLNTERVIAPIAE